MYKLCLIGTRFTLQLHPLGSDNLHLYFYCSTESRLRYQIMYLHPSSVWKSFTQVIDSTCVNVKDLQWHVRVNETLQYTGTAKLRQYMCYVVTLQELCSKFLPWHPELALEFVWWEAFLYPFSSDTKQLNNRTNSGIKEANNVLLHRPLINFWQLILTHQISDCWCCKLVSTFSSCYIDLY